MYSALFRSEAAVKVSRGPLRRSPIVRRQSVFSRSKAAAAAAAPNRDCRRVIPSFSKFKIKVEFRKSNRRRNIGEKDLKITVLFIFVYRVLNNN